MEALRRLTATEGDGGQRLGRKAWSEGSHMMSALLSESFADLQEKIEAMYKAGVPAVGIGKCAVVAWQESPISLLSRDAKKGFTKASVKLKRCHPFQRPSAWTEAESRPSRQRSRTPQVQKSV